MLFLVKITQSKEGRKEIVCKPKSGRVVVSRLQHVCCWHVCFIIIMIIIFCTHLARPTAIATTAAMMILSLSQMNKIMMKTR